MRGVNFLRTRDYYIQFRTKVACRSGGPMRARGVASEGLTRPRDRGHFLFTGLTGPHYSSLLIKNKTIKTNHYHLNNNNNNNKLSVRSVVITITLQLSARYDFIWFRVFNVIISWRCFNLLHDPELSTFWSVICLSNNGMTRHPTHVITSNEVFPSPTLVGPKTSAAQIEKSKSFFFRQ